MAASDVSHESDEDPISALDHPLIPTTERAGMLDNVLELIPTSWGNDFEQSISGYPHPPDGKIINNYLPSELLRHIFLYSIEVHQMKSGHLASVCRYWRSVITSIASLWSTLRVGTWTEREQVITWLQRAYPKKVVIDTQRDEQESPNTQPFAALQDAIANTREWNELTISSCPPEHLASPLGFPVASPLNGLKVLHIAAGCANSPAFAHLIDLVPTEAPLSELRLHASFASAHFLQPHWLPVLQNLTALIVNGRGIHEPFLLLPAFTQLRIFEAGHLLLPMYEPNIDLPLLDTLHKLLLRASSVQWMAGRQFPRLEECAVLLPYHWAAVQQHSVELPSCKKFIYHGYPMTTVQHFHVPQMKSFELRSHDCKEQRVYRQLHHLCRLDGTISKLTTLHVALGSSERPLSKILKYLDALQELVVSIVYPSPSWQNFLQSLAAKPSTNDWPEWTAEHDPKKWENWCCSQTWHANVLPCLNYLSIQSLKGFSRIACLDNCPLLRLVGWTRAQVIPPLQHLKVWKGRGTTDDIVVDYISTDYISTGYMERHLGPRSDEYDRMIVRGMVTQSLVMTSSETPLLKLHSTVFFRQLQSLEIAHYAEFVIHSLSYLEQIKVLKIFGGTFPANVLNTHFPLVNTLEHLRLDWSTLSWMLGRTFRALKEVELILNRSEDLSVYRGLRVDLPACTTLKSKFYSAINFDFFSTPNLQILVLEELSGDRTHNATLSKSLPKFLLNCTYLQQLEVAIYPRAELDSWFQFVFCDAREQGVWKDIRSVEFGLKFNQHYAKIPSLNQMLRHKQHYGKSWREFTVTREEGNPRKPGIILKVSM